MTTTYFRQVLVLERIKYCILNGAKLVLLDQFTVISLWHKSVGTADVQFHEKVNPYVQNKIK